MRSSILNMPIEERESAEKKRASFAGTFDQLILVNMALSKSARQLINAVYILAALDGARLLYDLLK